MRKRSALLFQAAFATLLLMAPPAANAAEPSNPGKTAYLRYCSACHGESGKGDGVVSGFMQPKPTDLTQIAKQNNGQFPQGRMVQVIDGRATLRAHGDPDMPVWGEVFLEQDGMTTHEQAAVRAKVMLITDYLRSIQEK
jgi:mono/diheme cytochrome c family protein